MDSVEIFEANRKRDDTVLRVKYRCTERKLKFKKVERVATSTVINLAKESREVSKVMKWKGGSSVEYTVEYTERLLDHLRE